MMETELHELARKGLRLMAIEILRRLKAGDSVDDVSWEAFDKCSDVFLMLDGPPPVAWEDGGTAARRDAVRVRYWILNGGPAHPSWPGGSEDSDTPF